MAMGLLKPLQDWLPHETDLNKFWTPREDQLKSFDFSSCVARILPFGSGHWSDMGVSFFKVTFFEVGFKGKPYCKTHP